MSLFIYQQFQRNNFELTFYTQVGLSYNVLFWLGITQYLGLLEKTSYFETSSLAYIKIMSGKCDNVVGYHAYSGDTVGQSASSELSPQSSVLSQ